MGGGERTARIVLLIAPKQMEWMGSASGRAKGVDGGDAGRRGDASGGGRSPDILIQRFDTAEAKL